MKIALVDTLHANLRSVQRALEEARTQLSVRDSSRITVVRTHDPDLIRSSDGIVVPGQGGFGKCLFGLRERGLDSAILEKMHAGTPYLGICLGLQALFESSEEAPNVPGLGYFRGTCEQLTPQPGIKIPHMGWNELQLEHGGHPVLEAAGGTGTWMYFVHSYHGVPSERSIVKATVTHGPHVVVAAVARDNVVATQFHPEKSQRAGIELLAGFLRL
jgi:imidazole glycerol-phosphate synthase subunit HisH